MEILSKYYKSLKQASDYLDNIELIYARQVDAYNILSERLDSLLESDSENLCECIENLKKDKGNLIVRLFLTFLLDNALFYFAIFLINVLFALGIPFFISGIGAIFFFMLQSSKKIGSLVSISEMKRKVDASIVLLGKSRLDSSLVDLIHELEANIKRNENFIEDFREAIDEYMSLLLAQENKLLPYGQQVSLDNEIQILEEGLKKLNLNYRE